MRALVLVFALLGLSCHREVRGGGEVTRDESCRRCLAQGRTWQGVREDQCTANCELQDTFCYRDACPAACSRASCSSCLSEDECRSASCTWNTSGEAMWCTAPKSAQTDCQERRSTIERREGAALVVTMNVQRTCGSASTGETVELARVPLDPAQTCPAGQRVVEQEQGKAAFVWLPEYATQLEREAPGALQALEDQLAIRTQEPGVTFARALVVDCSQHTFLVFSSGGSARPEVVRAGVGDAGVAEAPHTDCGESAKIGTLVGFGRQLSTGLFPGPSSLTTWRLGRTGTTAKLVIAEYVAPKAGPPADAQPEGTWSCRTSSTLDGTVTSQGVMRFPSSPDGEPFELRCTSRVMPVAPVTARRVRTPTRDECTASRWNTAARRSMSVLVCSFGSEPTPQTFFLAKEPGVEQVTYDDECVDPAGALREIARDGGVATAVKLSEQPREFVPAGLRPATPRR